MILKGYCYHLKRERQGLMLVMLGVAIAINRYRL